MSPFPCLEVVWSGTPLLEAGSRFAIGETTTLGRGADVELSLPGLGARHCRIERRYERWWVLDLSTTEDVRHNGAQVTNAELEHADLIELGALVLRFLLREVVDERDETMEAAIRAAPDDAARYGVYADWLIDRGVLLGERMARPRYEGSGKWLGRLARPWAEGELELSWYCGVPMRAVVRRLESTGRELEQVISLMRAEPFFRFLRLLEVDLEAIAQGPEVEPLLASLEPSALADAFPMLTRLTLGPVTHALEVPHTSRFETVVLRAPPFTRVEVLGAPATLTVTPGPGARVTLSPSTPTLVGQTADCAVRVVAPQTHPAFRLAVRFSHERVWRVESLVRTADGLLRVNGHDCLRAVVRPGDVVELSPGLLLRVMPHED
jgi:uncharacterized protein (TIGR02996 family)